MAAKRPRKRSAEARNDRGPFPLIPLKRRALSDASVARLRGEVARLERMAQVNLGALADCVHMLYEAGDLPLHVAGPLILLLNRIALSSGWVDRRFNDMILMARAETVRDAHENEGSQLTWSDAYEYAAAYLRSTEAAGGRDTMEAAYKKYRRMLRTQPERFYLWRGASRCLERWGVGHVRQVRDTREARLIAESRRGGARPQRNPRRR